MVNANELDVMWLMLAIAWYEKMPIYYFVVSLLNQMKIASNQIIVFVYKLFLSLAIEPVSHFDFVEQTFILCILGPAKLLRSHHLNVLDLRAGFKCKRCVARIGRWFIYYGKVKLFFFLLLFTVLLQKLCKRVKIVRARERELSYRFMNSACIKMEI